MSRRLTARGEQRRAELLAFATERFATNGYHSTSVTELVDGLGVGKGVFYWYFDSKEELFLEILKSGQRELRRVQRAAIGDEDDPLERIARGIRASFHWWADHRHLYELLQFATTEAGFRTAVRAGERTAVADAAKHIRAAIDAGQIPDADADLLAQSVLGVSAVLARTQLLRAGQTPDEVADATIDFCFHGLLGSSSEAARRSA